MVDIHSHILYGIDDGAKTIEDSLRMLEIARASGTTDIVATPHSDLRYAFDIGAVERIADELRARATTDIRIHRGCDFHLHYDNIVGCMQNPNPYTINGKGYLMVEFAETSIPDSLTEVLREMVARGITPVITHPERNHQLMLRMAQLAEWVRGGCLVQLTAGSFTGSFGERARENCRKLMDHRLAHFVASDAHDTEYRPPDMRPAREMIVADFGPQVAERLFEQNPRKALTGEPIEIEDPELASGKKAWYQFW